MTFLPFIYDIGHILTYKKFEEKDQDGFRFWVGLD